MCAPETKIKSCREFFTHFFVINTRIYIVFSQRKKGKLRSEFFQEISEKRTRGSSPHNIDSPLKKNNLCKVIFTGLFFVLNNIGIVTERYSPEISTCRVVLYGNVNLINAIYEGLFSVNALGADIIKILGYYKVETGRRLVSRYVVPQVAVFFCSVPC